MKAFSRNLERISRSATIRQGAVESLPVVG